MELTNEYELWATIAGTILFSTLVHGLTAGIAVEQRDGRAADRADRAAVEPG